MEMRIKYTELPTAQSREETLDRCPLSLYHRLQKRRAWLDPTANVAARTDSHATDELAAPDNAAAVAAAAAGGDQTSSASTSWA